MSNTDGMIAEELSASKQTPCMTIAVLVCKRGNSSTLARSLRKNRQNTATEPITAVVKEEDALNFTEAVELSHVSPWTVTAQEALL